MSLINDALKKAQKLQTPQPPASAPPPDPAPAAPTFAPAVVRRGKPVGFETMLLGLVALAVVLVGATVIAVLGLRKEEKPVVAAAPPSISPAPAALPGSAPATPAAAPDATPPAPTVTPLPSQLPASEPAPQSAVSPPPASPSPVPVMAAPVSAPPGESPSPSVSVQINAAAAPAPIAVAALPPVPVSKIEPPAVKPAPKPSPPTAPLQNRKILVYLDNLRVTGVRAAGPDSKVLMNDRVYRVNDMVDYELGLRLTGVSTAALSFVDDNGVVYTKTL